MDEFNGGKNEETVIHDQIDLKNLHNVNLNL